MALGGRPRRRGPLTFAILAPVIPELEAIPDAVRREASFALTLGVGLFGAAAGRLIFGAGLTPFAWLVVLGLVGWLAADLGRSLGRLAAFCVLGGALAVGPARGLPPLEILLSTIFVGPASLALFLFVLPLFAQLRPYLAAGSHEDAALARLAASRWLLAVAALATLVAALERDVPLAVASVLVLLFAAVRWALGRDAFTRLRGWLDRARAEDSPRWRVVDAAQVEALDSLALEPLVRAEPLDGVLVQTGDGGPYRGGLGGTPVALVPRDRAAPDRRAGWSLPRADAGYLVALLLALAAPTLGVWIAAVVLYELLVVRGARVDHVLVAGAAFAFAAVALASLLARGRRRFVFGAGVLSFAHVVCVVLVSTTR